MSLCKENVLVTGRTNCGSIRTFMHLSLSGMGDCGNLYSLDLRGISLRAITRLYYVGVIMEDALEEAIKEINWAYTSESVPIKRRNVVNILRKYYKAHTIELLEMLEAQHSVADTFGFEGTD